MTVIVFVLCLIASFTKCFCIKVHFMSCGRHGFSCQNSSIYPDKQDVTFHCPDDALKGIIIDFWIWDMPATYDIAKLTIKHCHTLRLRFGCTKHLQNIKILHVRHITDLRIFPDQLVCNPPAVIFEHVEILHSIPRNTFSQTQSMCDLQNCALNKLVFENIEVGIIETNGIEMIEHVQLFRMTNVVIQKINVGGIKIVDHENGSIYLLNSILHTVDMLGLQIIANKLTITECAFNELSYCAINATLHTFEFSSNSVMNIAPAGLSIEAQNVIILRNHFYNVKTGSFQKVGPLLNTSTFNYNFVENFIKYVDAGGLHPHIAAFDNFASTIIFANNSFYCTCDGLSWLATEFNFGIGYRDSQHFYKNILDQQYNNTCVFKTNCILPLKAVEKIAPNGECQVSSLQAESDFCENYDFYESSKLRMVNISWITLLSIIFSNYHCLYFLLYV